ncbi:MAG: GntR family transcriptional regulator [Lachnospiraceae bacterium]
MIMKLDFSSSTPIYQQIRDQMVQAVADGTLSNGDKLPTIRALAQEAGINTMTVNKAYQLLKQEGYIITDRRNGAVVQGTGGGRGEVEKKIRKKLELMISEAKIAGISEETFLNICRELY